MSATDLLTTPFPLPFSVDNIAAAPKYSQLWEVVVVAASPVVLVFCLCFCIVCLVFRKHETVADTTVVQQHQPRRNALANLLRNLPPPPKYDVAVTTSSPPPLYSDVEKSIIFDPLASLAAARRAERAAAHGSHGSTPTSTTASSLSIQYLYPPRYDSQSEPARVHRVATPPSPPAYSSEIINEEEQRPEELPSYSAGPVAVSA